MHRIARIGLKEDRRITRVDRKGSEIKEQVKMKLVLIYKIVLSKIVRQNIVDTIRVPLWIGRFLVN